MAKYYGGVTGERKGEIQIVEIFTSPTRPTKATHGGRYLFAYGPFRSRTDLLAWFKKHPALMVELRGASRRNENPPYPRVWVEYAMEQLLKGVPRDKIASELVRKSFRKLSYARAMHIVDYAIYAIQRDYDRYAGGVSKRNENPPPEKRLKLDPIAKHQIAIAKRTLQMPESMLGVMGGMTREEAEAILRKYGLWPLSPESRSQSNPRVPEKMLAWRERLPRGAIMSPATFKRIERAAAKAGYDDPRAVAGAAYWRTLRAKYREAHPGTKVNPLRKGTYQRALHDYVVQELSRGDRGPERIIDDLVRITKGSWGPAQARKFVKRVWEEMARGAKAE